MRAKILGRLWGVRFVSNMGKDDGACDPPSTPAKEIRIQGGLRGTPLLETVIHESLHAAGWHIDEEFVEQFSHDLARLLRHKSIWERIDGE